MSGRNAALVTVPTKMLVWLPAGTSTLRVSAARIAWYFVVYPSPGVATVCPFAATLRQRGAADDLDELVDWTIGHLDIAG